MDVDKEIAYYESVRDFVREFEKLLFFGGEVGVTDIDFFSPFL